MIINGPHWPHFICPNCRTVADLEAELDDPYTNGDWEEVEAADQAPVSEQTPAERATNDEASSEEQSNKSSEARAVAMPKADAGALSHNNSGSSDLELVDSTDDSGHEHLVRQVAEDLGYMNIEEPPSPVESDDSRPGTLPIGATVSTLR